MQCRRRGLSKICQSQGWSETQQDLTIDVKAPPPRDLFRENTPEDWPESARKSPHAPNHSKILPSFPKERGLASVEKCFVELVGCHAPHTEKITDTDVGQDDQTTSTDTLNGSSGE